MQLFETNPLAEDYRKWNLARLMVTSSVFTRFTKDYHHSWDVLNVVATSSAGVRQMLTSLVNRMLSFDSPQPRVLKQVDGDLQLKVKEHLLKLDRFAPDGKVNAEYLLLPKYLEEYEQKIHPKWSLRFKSLVGVGVLFAARLVLFSPLVVTVLAGSTGVAYLLCWGKKTQPEGAKEVENLEVDIIKSLDKLATIKDGVTLEVCINDIKEYDKIFSRYETYIDFLKEKCNNL